MPAFAIIVSEFLEFAEFGEPPSSSENKKTLQTHLSPNSVNLFGFFDFDYLTTFIHSGFRVDAMRKFRFARILVDVILRQLQSIVSAALARA